MACVGSRAPVEHGRGPLKNIRRHMRPKHFKQTKMTIEGHTTIKNYCYKLVTFLQQLVGQGRSSLTR